MHIPLTFIFFHSLHCFIVIDIQIATTYTLRFWDYFSHLGWSVECATYSIHVFPIYTLRYLVNPEL